MKYCAVYQQDLVQNTKEINKYFEDLQFLKLLILIIIQFIHVILSFAGKLINKLVTVYIIIKTRKTKLIENIRTTQDHYTINKVKSTL